MAKPDPVIEQMNSFALALLVAAREAKVETAAGEMDHLSIAERVNVFREVAKWISIKNRLPEPAEGGDLDEYRARLGQPRVSDPTDPRGQAKVLVEHGRAIAERAITDAPAIAHAHAYDTAPASAHAPRGPENVPSAPPVGTPRKAFNADGTAVKGNPSLRPFDEAGGGPELEALRARLPSGSSGDAGGVRRDSGVTTHPVTGRLRGFRRLRDGADEPDATDAG